MSAKINIQLGTGTVVDPFAIVGYVPASLKDENCSLTVGKDSIIRSYTIVYVNSSIDDCLQTGHYTLIRENNVLGTYCKVGTGTELGPGNNIGSNVMIHGGCFLEMALVGNNVFIGPNTVLLDDPHPPCPRYKECVGGVTLEDYVRIGGNCTLLPGITIGRNSLMGGGSVVTGDVPPNSVICGNPAKVVKEIHELTCVKEFYQKPYEWDQK